MRPDVKLGVMLAFVMVVVAGGYYMYRGRHESPIPLSGNHADIQAKGGAKLPSSAANTPGQPSANLPSRSAQAPARKASKSHATESPTPPAKRNKRTTDRTKKPGRPETNNAVAQGPVNKGAARNAAPVSKRVANTTSSSPPARTPTSGKSRKGSAQLTPTRQNEPSTVPTSKQTARTANKTQKSTRDRRPTQSLSAGIAVETHRVQPGDTFAMLAKTYYGDEKYTQHLLDHNRHIDAPTHLRPGDLLKIPPLPPAVGLAAPPASKRSGPAAAKTRTNVARTYTVRPGDSFYAIAQEELADATRWEELLKLNDALVQGDPKKLRVGQVIRLPAR